MHAPPEGKAAGDIEATPPGSPTPARKAELREKTPSPTPPKTSVWQNRKVLLYCYAIYLCSFFTFYEAGLTNSFIALPAFVHKFGALRADGPDSGSGERYLNASLQQLIFVVSDLGWLSTLGAAWLLYDRVGRVRILQLGLVTSLGAIVLATLAPSTPVFLVARFFVGAGVGFMNSASFLWVGESTVAGIRNLSSVFHGIKMAIGYLLAAIVCHLFSHGTSPHHYRIPLIIGMGPQAASLALTFLLPETPRWYALQSRRSDARRSLVALRPRTHTPAMIDEELDAIFAAIEWERGMESKPADGTAVARLRHTLGQLNTAFTGIDRRRTLLAMFNGVYFVASGVQVALTSAAYLFALLGSTSPFYYTIIMKAVAVASALTAAFTLDGLPRRTLILWSLVLGLIGMLGTGIFASLPESSGISNQGKMKGMTAFFSIVVFAQYSGANISANTIMVELPRQELRALTLSLGSGFDLVLSIAHSFLTPEFINPEKLNLGGKYAYIFVGTNLFCFIVTYFCLPETRNVTLEEMDVLFEAKVPARKFQRYIQAHRARAERKRDGDFPDADASKGSDLEKDGDL